MFRPITRRFPGATEAARLRAVLRSFRRSMSAPAPVALIVLALVPFAGCAAPARPSLVLITIDTLRADHLGCYGYARATSPRIDRLAAEGALFERAFTSLPRTTQSIASILTGRYPKGHGARGLFSTLSHANLTLAEILLDEGFATAAFTSNMFLRPGQGFEQGFELYDNPQHQWAGNSAPEVTAKALRWLEDRPRNRPFFLWVHYLDPHWTYDPPAPYDRSYDPRFEGTLTMFDDLDARRLTKGQIIFQNRLDPRQVEHVVALYDGEIASVDAAIGPLVDRLDRLDEPVLIVLTSDHGESLGEHDYFFAHGEYLYDPGLRIPLLLRLPGTIPAALRIDALAQNIDIAPTILRVLGIDRLQGVDGRPLFRNGGGRGAILEAAPGRSTIYAESDFHFIHPENPRYYIEGPAGKWSAAYDGTHKLIHIPRDGSPVLELYDTSADPGETIDLAADAAHASRRDRLLRQLQRFVDYDSGQPPPSPDGLDPAERERLRSLGYIN